MLRRLLIPLCVLTLIVASAMSTFAKDRDRDRRRQRDEDVERPPQVNPEAERLRGEAEQAYQRGDYARVIALASQLIEYFPSDNVHVAWYMRASARVEQGRAARSGKTVREGVADARQALAVAGNRFPWLYIPYVFGMTSLAEIENRPEHADVVVKILTPVLERPVVEGFSAEDHANLFYQRGLAQAAKRDFKAAAADHAEAIKLSPQHLGSHIKRAEALSGLGKMKDALAAYDDAVRVFPNALVVFNDRGSFRRTTGDLDGAVSDFSRALQLDPKFAVGYINRGACLADLDQPAVAEGDFTEALNLKLEPAMQAVIYRMRATARAANGNAATALNDFNAAARLTPQEPQLFEERAFVQFCRKDFAAAAADFAKARELNAQWTRIVPWQALSLLRAGKSADALALIDTAAAAKIPPAAWSAKLCAYLKNELTDEELLAAAEVPPAMKNQQLCEAQFFLGQKKLIADDIEKAAEHFRQSTATKSFQLSAYRAARYELEDFKK